MTAAIKQRRSYKKRDDVVSVTKVLDDSLGWKVEGLKRWSAATAAAATAQFISEGGAFVEAAERGARAIYKAKEDAGDQGGAGHDMIAAYLRGENPEDALDVLLDPELAANARVCFEKFAAWWPTAGFEVLFIEEEFIDPVTGVAGTADLILRHRVTKRLVVADIKTGKRAYPETALQLGGYANLAQTHGHNVLDGLIIHVPVEGDLNPIGVPEPILRQAALAFAALVVVHKSRDLLKTLIPKKVA